MSEKLKPCPACGGEATQARSERFVCCPDPKCGVSGPWGDHYGSKWNALPRRTDAKAPAGMSDGELIARTIISLRGALVAMKDYLGDDDNSHAEKAGAELARREQERQT